MCNGVSEPLDRACAGRKTCVRTATIEPNERGAVKLPELTVFILLMSEGQETSGW